MPDINPRGHRRDGLSPEQRRLLAQRIGGGAPPAQPTIPRPTIPRLGDGPTVPLSPAQRRHWFLWRLDPTDTAHHLGAALRIDGVVDEGALRHAFAKVIEHHEALRTVVVEDATGKPRGRIIDPAPFDLSRDVATGEEQAMEMARRFAEHPFDLTTGPLLRGRLIRLEPEAWSLVVVMHHIATDAWSRTLILRDFAAHYRAALGSRDAPVPAPDAIRYADHAAWLDDRLTRGEFDGQVAFWRTQIGEVGEALDLQSDHPATVVEGGKRRGGTYTVSIPEATLGRLRALVRGHGAGIFAALLTGYALALHQRSGRDRIAIGVPVAGRNLRETEGVVGLFVNTLVHTISIDRSASLSRLLDTVRDTGFEAQANQDPPFEHLVEVLNPERRLGANPLFQTMFNHLGHGPAHDGHKALADLPGMTVRAYTPLPQAPQLDLSLDTTEDAEGGIEAKFIYDADRFDADTVARIAGDFLRILHHMATAPETAVRALPTLSEADSARIARWSGDATPCDAETPVHHRIAAKAAADPDAVALTWDGGKMTRGALDRWTDRLAHGLIARGVGTETVVGLMAERSPEMVAMLLAVMKAGGAYLPLDPDLPADRLAGMIADAGAELVLTQAHLHTRAMALPGATVEMIAPFEGDDQAPVPLNTAVHGESPAYVIFTSGSTGRPKGAVNRHRALANRIAWMDRAYGLTPTDVVAQKTPFGFDVSVWEFLWPLMMGARLALVPPGHHRDPALLSAALTRAGVTVAHFVPSMLRALVDFHEEVGTPAPKLRLLICSGEALPADLARRAKRLFPDAAIHNLYGPTEAAIDVTHWPVGEVIGDDIPIGRPIDGLITRVLDRDLSPTPPGVAGELYLGGVGLGRGYLGRPGLTAERFVPDPFDPDGGRLYRTGDLVRWRSDGALLYLGRLDHQVKINGLRVELGEIECRLRELDGVGDAVVVARNTPSGRSLTAYWTTSPGGAFLPDETTARRALARTLPDHMIPAVFVALEALPLNPNGKVDRNALPAPVTTAATGFEPPCPGTEATIADIWSAALRVPQVGRHDNFFALGGHSLLAAALARRIGDALGVEVALADLFHAQTPAELAARLDALRANAAADDDALRDIDAFMNSFADAP